MVIEVKGMTMNELLAMIGVSGWEITIIFLVILLLFGARRLPDLARGLGQSLREFKKATDDETAANDKKIDVAAVTPTDRPKTND